ncbi:MAG: hypothetical protein LBJ47_10610 [Tannerella sp.]|nr:hypothetical protein [Tannerella sp.]
MNTRYNTQTSPPSIAGPVIASVAKQSRHRPCSPDGCLSTACVWIASYLAMTGQGNAMTEQGDRNDGGTDPSIASGVPHSVIASVAKQSRHRPCSPDGSQSTACAWIASYLAMTGQGVAMTGQGNAMTGQRNAMTEEQTLPLRAASSTPSLRA